MTKTRWLIVAAVLVIAAAIGGWVALGDDDDSGGSVAEECERAYEAGAGNAAVSDRESWLEDCIAETEVIRGGQ